MFTDADIVILVPMLGRPHRVTPLLESIQATAPRARVLFCVSPHDGQVHAAVDAAGRERITVPYQPRGDYARKINTGYRHTTQPLIFTAADDLRFHPGWWQVACAMLTNGIGVVGTNDMGNPRVTAGEHSTHSLVTRDYADTRGGPADQCGAILHEGYEHEFVDDELIGVARSRGAFVFAREARVEHLHPNWNRSIPADDLYRAQGVRMRRSRPLFNRRRALWA